MNDQVIIALARKFANESKLTPSEVKQSLEAYLEEHPDALDQDAVEAILGERLDDIVLAQQTQPTVEDNRIWFPTGEGETVQIPTYAEFETLNDAVGNMSVEEILLRNNLPGTTTAVTLDSNNNPTSIVHSMNGATIRTDSFVWGNGVMTETRTASTKRITITTNLTTLVQTVSAITDVV